MDSFFGFQVKYSVRKAWDSVLCHNSYYTDSHTKSKLYVKVERLTWLLMLGDNHQGDWSKERKRATARIISYVHVEEFHLPIYRKWVCTFYSRAFLSLVQRSNPAFPTCLCSISYKKFYDNTVWETAQCAERVSESHTHQAALNGGTAHWYSGSPHLLTITSENSRAAKIIIIICSVTGDQ